MNILAAGKRRSSVLDVISDELLSNMHVKQTYTPDCEFVFDY